MSRTAQLRSFSPTDRRTLISKEMDTSELRVLENFCLANQTPYTLGVWLLIQTHDLDGILSLSMDPHGYHDRRWNGGFGPDRFRTDYQAARMLSKFPFEGVRDTRAAAIAAWDDAESNCAITNRLIESWNAFPMGAELNAVLHGASRICDQVLGDIDPVEWIEACRFGPGVTSDSKDKLAYDKFIGPLGVTPEASKLLAFAIASSPAWSRVRNEKPTLTLCGAQAFVPKNAKTDRSIETQPSGNVYLQAGLGRVIRQRLRLAGCDLSDQGWNQELARRGSISGNLVTVDLKSASDTVSYRLVEHILPPRWFDLLCILRVPLLTKADGSTHLLEKFSSMGNGYTFELESLLFWCILQSCRQILGDRSEASVYGDDIICSQRVFPLLREVLEGVGFLINTEKSFSSSPFRESCGSDFFDGLDVRPLYIRERLSNVENHIKLANRFWRYAARRGGDVCLCSSLHGCWKYVVSSLPQSARRFLSGPYADHDRWLIQPQDWLMSPNCSGRLKHVKGTGRYQWLTYSLTHYVSLRKKKGVSLPVVWLNLLYKLERRKNVQPNPYSKVVEDEENFVLYERKVRDKVKLRVSHDEWVPYCDTWT